MPSSLPEGKEWIEQKLTEISRDYKIGRVLDIGAGQGTYSDLFRSRFGDHWSAIEIFEPYIGEYKLDRKYNTIYVLDARNFLPPSRYSVVFFGDVLEHMTLDNAKYVYGLLRFYADYLFISIPIVPWEQGPRFNNPYECHITQWTHELVMSTFSGIVDSYQGPNVGCYMALGEH